MASLVFTFLLHLLIYSACVLMCTCAQLLPFHLVGPRLKSKHLYPLTHPGSLSSVLYPDELIDRSGEGTTVQRWAEGQLLPGFNQFLG